MHAFPHELARFRGPTSHEAPGDGVLATWFSRGAQGCGNFAVATSAAVAPGPSSPLSPGGGDRDWLCLVSPRRGEISRFPCSYPSLNWIWQHFHSQFRSVPSGVAADRHTPGGHNPSDRSTLTMKSFYCTGISVPSSPGPWEPLLVRGRAAPRLLFSSQLIWA